MVSIPSMSCVIKPCTVVCSFSLIHYAEKKAELQEEQDNFLRSAQEMLGQEISHVATAESSVTGKRQVKKTKRMLQFEAGEASGSQPLEKKKRASPKKVPSGGTKSKISTAGPPPKVSKSSKLKDAFERAKAQQSVCQQMLTSRVSKLGWGGVGLHTTNMKS